MRAIIQALLAVLIPLAPLQAQTKQVDVVRNVDVRPIIFDMDRDNCVRQPHLTWCSGEAPAQGVVPTWHDIADIDNQVRRKWIANDTYEWGSHYETMKKGQKFKCDCDGLAILT